MRALLFSFSLWGWLLKLGGPGLLLFGLLDNSVFPTPGGMDLLVIIFSANAPDFWWYYAAWATAGSLLGGYLTFRLGRKGGRELLDKRIPKNKVDKICARVEKHNFLALFFPALLPPPVPLSPFLLAAGAGKMTRTSFFVALLPARAIRYGLLAWFGSAYGGWIFKQVALYRTPVLVVFTILAIIGGIFGLRWWRKHRRQGCAEEEKQPAAA